MFRQATVAAGRVLAHGGGVPNITLRQPAIMNTVTRMSVSRPYTTNKPNNSKKEATKTESILTDDILARAGFEETADELRKKEPTEENEQDQSGESGEEQGSKKRRRRQTSKDIKREKAANWFYLSTLVGLVGGVGYMSRDWTSEEEQTALDGRDIDNGYTPQLMWSRLQKRWNGLFSFFSEPAFENLLPPPAPEAYRRPYTLVLTLDDLLIHSEWDTKNGWRTAKRPGVDYFLGYLSQYYEIVIFATNYQMYSEKIVQKLDPYRGFISYQLYREACRYKDGKLIKDLSLLNRDLAKTIIIDVADESVSSQPENAVVLKPWDGKSDDTLVRLIPCLEYMAASNQADVRQFLSNFNDKSNIVPEFEAKEQKMREKWRQDNQNVLSKAGKPNAGAFLAKLMGLHMPNTEPKMPLDVIRETGQKNYEHFISYLKETAPINEEHERLMKEKFGEVKLADYLTGNTPTQEEIIEFQKQLQEQEMQRQKEKQEKLREQMKQQQQQK